MFLFHDSTQQREEFDKWKEFDDSEVNFCELDGIQVMVTNQPYLLSVWLQMNSHAH